MLRVPVVIIFFLLLWAVDIWVMDRLRIQYSLVLSVKSVSLSALFLIPLLLLAVYAVVMTFLSNSLGFSIVSGVTAFYLSIAFLHFMPFSLGVDGRIGFFRLLRAVLWPSAAPAFPEVLLADALTSLSKVLKDLGTYFVVLYATLKGIPVIDCHDSAMIFLAFLASLPFLIRVRQCFLQLETCPDFTAKLIVLVNLGKYLTAFPPIWITAVSSLGFVSPNLPQILTVAAFLNSIYSFLWDILMDWGLLGNFCREGRLLRRPRGAVSWPIYFFAALVNLALRFSWTINRWPGFSQLHSSVIVLLIEVGEVCRRALWNVFRIEWEGIQQWERVSTKEDPASEKIRTGP